jgi:hypothetical protein
MIRTVALVMSLTVLDSWAAHAATFSALCSNIEGFRIDQNGKTFQVEKDRVLGGTWAYSWGGKARTGTIILQNSISAGSTPMTEEAPRRGLPHSPQRAFSMCGNLHTRRRDSRVGCWAACHLLSRGWSKRRDGVSYLEHTEDKQPYRANSADHGNHVKKPCYSMLCARFSVARP